jgi:2-dehydropantoate 2-reductase
MSGGQDFRILVMGAGGIGGTVTGYLTEVGANVTAVTTNAKIAAAVEEHGFRLRGDGNPRSVPGKIHLGVPEGEYDLVILATQPPQVEDAARTALPHLAEGGRMMCFQNGLCEQRVAKIIGDELRVIGGIVAWGASMPEPGVYDRTSAGGFTVGALSGKNDEFIDHVDELLEIIGPVTLTDNLAGARWSKLGINCAISSMGTVAGERLGPLVALRKVRRLCLEILTEVAAVARVENVKLEKVAGTFDVDWLCLSDAERTKAGSPGLAAKHALLFAVGMRYRRLRSSMLAAIERGRPPAIDFLNGEIVTRGQEHGIDVPVNAALTDTVKRIAAGELSSSRALLDKIFDDTAYLRS